MGPKRKVTSEAVENIADVKKTRTTRRVTASNAAKQNKAIEDDAPKTQRTPSTTNKRADSKKKAPIRRSVPPQKTPSSKNNNMVHSTPIAKDPAIKSAVKKTVRKSGSKAALASSDQSGSEEHTVVVKKQKKSGSLTTNAVSGISNDKRGPKVPPKTALIKAEKSRPSVAVDAKTSTLAKISPKKKEVDDSSSSESEWEDVSEDETQTLEDYEPEIPKEGIEITLEGPRIVKKREKKEFDMLGFIRCQINRAKKEKQLVLHQVHLLCLLARGVHVNNAINSDEVQAKALSLIPLDMLDVKVSSVNVEHIRKLVTWFRTTFVIDSNFKRLVDCKRMISRCFEYQKAPSSYEYNIMFVAITRVLKFDARLCISFYPVSFKPKDLLKKNVLAKVEAKANSVENDTKDVKDIPSTSKTQSSDSKPSSSVTKITKTKNKSSTTGKKETKTMNNTKASVQLKVPKSRSMPKRLSKNASYKQSSDEDYVDSDNSTSSEEDKKKHRPAKNIPSAVKKAKSAKNRKILSSDESTDSVDTKDGVECWVEIYSRAEQKWICVECSENICNKPYDVEKVARQPVTYVIAFDNKSYFKDVTKRYCSQWLTHTRKLRVVPDWWEDTIEPFLPLDTKQDHNEDSQMEANLLRKPLPQTIGEYKNHPLYALKRHLLKFEAIYPPDAPSVGFIRGEPVYARECVHKLHSRETWVKEARLVRVKEEPYKIVKARPKWDRVAGVMKTDLPLELFGFWQTEKYMPPVAWNGKVPRNEYGNVELFKPCMLPIGTVHLRNPGLNRVAKKLNIDCCPAVVGFDGHKGSIHPVFDGFIVCEEFKETVLAAWEEEQENIRKREEEKREKRIYGNWRKLIKGLLIRERIKRKYAVT